MEDLVSKLNSWHAKGLRAQAYWKDSRLYWDERPMRSGETRWTLAGGDTVELWRADLELLLPDRDSVQIVETCRLTKA